MANDIITPVGRIVQGSLFQKVTKSKKGRQLLWKNGMPRESIYVGLAISKNHAGYQGLMTTIREQARLCWPQNETQRPDFGWKMYDGDTPEFIVKDGFPGHTVLRLSTNFSIVVYGQDGRTVLTDPTSVKCGDYIDAVISVAANTEAEEPGLFLNLHAARLVGYGEQIVAVDYSKYFQTPGQMPTGASPAPVPSTPMPPMPPKPPEVHQMTVKAGGVLYEAFVAQGWTDEALRAGGYML